MSRPTLRIWLYAVLGLSAFFTLHLQLVLCWHSYYAHYPLPGYEVAMAVGRVAPFFTTSERAFLVTRLVLAILPLLSLPFAGGTPWRAAGALWSGVMMGVLAVWIATPALRNDSNLWPIDLVYLAFVTALPVLGGTIVYTVGEKLFGWKRAA